MRELYDVNIFLCYAYETATSKTLFTLRNSLNKQCQNPSFEKKKPYTYVERKYIKMETLIEDKNYIKYIFVYFTLSSILIIYIK